MRLKARVLDTDSSVALRVVQAEQEGALGDGVSDRLHKIPSEPWDAEDCVVTDAKLKAEECGHAPDLHHVKRKFTSFDFILSLLKLLKFRFGNQSLRVQIESLLLHNRVFKHSALFGKLVHNMVHGG